MEKPAGSGKRFVIIGLSAVGAALIAPACGSTEAGAANSAVDSAANTGSGGQASGTGGSGNGEGGGVHGTVVNTPSSGCSVAGRSGAAGSAGTIGLALLGLMGGGRKRRPRAD